jgi:hypothetical protein
MDYQYSFNFPSLIGHSRFLHVTRGLAHPAIFKAGAAMWNKSPQPFEVSQPQESQRSRIN